MRLHGLVLRLAALAVALAASPTAAAADDRPGDVRFFKRTDSAFDAYTTGAAPPFQAWMREHFFRAQVWSPYFDDKTGWYPQGLVSRNLYAVYAEDDGTLRDHPEWVLRDAGGSPLYIPWGCSGGTCPQYAGDVGDPAFRRAWITRARTVLARGYRGLWIDDVNLEFRVSDGDGRWRAPIDRRTGSAMTAADWRRYVAEFTEEIRAAFPDAEILHNAIWFAAQPARSDDPYVRRQIQAADWVNLERGVNDAGLRGGTGQWSLDAFLRYVDAVHAAGRSVVLDAFDDTASGREYNLAAYFLVSGPKDGLGLASMTPEVWWPLYDVHLGVPLGARTAWNGLLRRAFQHGVAIVNEPGASARTVVLERPYLDSGGRRIESLTLAGGQGAVLRRLPAAPDAPPAPAGTGGPRPVAPQDPASGPGDPTAGRAKDAPEGRPRFTMTVRRAVPRLHVEGVLRGVRGARVVLEVRSTTRGTVLRRATARIRPDGAYRFRARGLARGTYRVVVRLSSPTRSPARSSLVRVP